jgi:hypothetical protein
MQASQPRRHKIGDIVDARRGPAEICVALAQMADHGIQRVDRLVADDAGKPEQRAPKQRRNNAVGGVFRKALDRGARHPHLIKV